MRLYMYMYMYMPICYTCIRVSPVSAVAVYVWWLDPNVAFSFPVPSFSIIARLYETKNVLA